MLDTHWKGDDVDVRVNKNAPVKAFNRQAGAFLLELNHAAFLFVLATAATRSEAGTAHLTSADELSLKLRGFVFVINANQCLPVFRTALRLGQWRKTYDAVVFATPKLAELNAKKHSLSWFGEKSFRINWIANRASISFIPWLEKICLPVKSGETTASFQIAERPQHDCRIGFHVCSRE